MPVWLASASKTETFLSPFPWPAPQTARRNEPKVAITSPYPLTRSQQQPLDFFFLPFLLFFVGAAALGKAELAAVPVITKLSRAMSVMSWVASNLMLPTSSWHDPLHNC